MAVIVESIPNFSEGRGPGVIKQLENALVSIRGVALLDEHRDADHHRCVLTVAGSVESMEAAGLVGPLQPNGSREILVPAAVEE